jgi:hypothetical protein
MKRHFLRGAVFVLIVSMIASFLPVIAVAAENELVLKKIGHSSALEPVQIYDPAVRAVTLTVPFTYAGNTMEFATGGLSIEKDNSIATVVPAFNSGSAATIGGTGVTLTVTYIKSGNTTEYTTNYTISVVRAAKVDATFAGTINKTASVAVPNSAINDITFTATDFTSLYTAHDGGSIGGISFYGTPTTCGILRFDGNAYSQNSKISIGDVGKLSFDAVMPGSVSYFVYAYAGSDTTTPIGKVTLNITVSEIVAPTISGSVTKTVSAGATVSFSAADFSSRYDLHGGTLASIAITPTNSGYGTWYNNSSAFSGAASISAGDLAAGRLTFRGYTAGTASFNWTVTTEKGTSAAGSGSITVSGSSATDINYTTAANTPKALSGADFNTVCATTTGYSLNFIDIAPPSSSYGTLYYNYSSPSNPGTALSGVTRLYYSTAPGISSLTFVPANNFTGSVSISYSGTNIYSTQYYGTLKITVGATSGDVSYTTAVNTPKAFSGADFNTVCATTTGYSLNFIDIAPPSSSYGTLYYNYSSPSSPGTALPGVTRLYYSTAPGISSLTFVPANNFTGSVSISYTGTNIYSTQYSGTLKITVGASSGDVSYTTAVNTPKALSGADFNTVCVNTTGYTLNYIDIAPPSSAYGTLYFNYTSTSSPGTALPGVARLYYGTTPNISSLTFVPANNFTGSVSISYTGTNIYSTQYSGTLKITVGASSGDVSYTTAVNTPKAFSGADFNTVCGSTTGYNLNYIDIAPPSSAYGTLYYNYSSPSSPGTALSGVTRLYYSTTPGISSLTFVPASNFTGAVTISYTGTNTFGTTYNGALKITVGSGNKVTYTTTKNTAKALSEADFNTACVNATGAALSYISIASPSSAYGTLYAGYTSATSPGTAVTSSTQYYANGTPSISTLTFVPASNFTGTATISYGGVTTNGTSFAGTLEITVTSTVSDISYTTSKNAAVKFSAANFTTVCTGAMGVNLNYVTFTLPASANGTLYLNYSTATHSGTAATATTVYFAGNTPSIDAVSFVPAVNYTGTVAITYTAVTADSRTYTGKINVTVSPKTGSRYFSDIGSTYDWASLAVDYLYEEGVAKGISSTLYSPGKNISRGDFVLMLYRAMKFTGSTASNFSDVPKGSYYYDAIAAAKALGIAQGGLDNKFNPTSALSRQDAMLLIYRTLTVTGKSVQTGTTSDIASFSDKDQISGYALVAVQTLVKAGVVTGSYGKINPKGSLTRAEMAVILYRVEQKW